MRDVWVKYFNRIHLKTPISVLSTRSNNDTGAVISYVSSLTVQKHYFEMNVC